MALLRRQAQGLAFALRGQARVASALGEKQRARDSEHAAAEILTSLGAVALLAPERNHHASASTGLHAMKVRVFEPARILQPVADRAVDADVRRPDQRDLNG